MSYAQSLGSAGNDAARWEEIYQGAVQVQQVDDFAAAVDANYSSDPGNLLFAAWYFRLAAAARQTSAAPAARRTVAWAAALLLAGLNGLLFWWLSDIDRFMVKLNGANALPVLLLVWAPAAAIFVLAFLTWAGRRNWRLPAGLALALAVLAPYPLWACTQATGKDFQLQYLTLVMLDLPVVAWVAVGLFLLRTDRSVFGRFAFLIESIEVLVMGGLLAIALGIVAVVTVALFQALGIVLGVTAQRLLLAGGGLIPVLAVAIMFDPHAPPSRQAFDEGWTRLITLLMRLLLPLTLLILAVYVAFIPFNFWKPFENRDALIIYNAMLFAVMVLLAGATPLTLTDLGARQQIWLRRGLAAVATLALLVGIYALAAITYRTLQEGWTPNRATFIGWNLINLGLLIWLLAGQLRSRAGDWHTAIQKTYGFGLALYGVWSLTVVAIVPFLF